MIVEYSLLMGIHLNGLTLSRTTFHSCSSTHTIYNSSSSSKPLKCAVSTIFSLSFCVSLCNRKYLLNFVLGRTRSPGVYSLFFFSSLSPTGFCVKLVTELKCATSPAENDLWKESISARSTSEETSLLVSHVFFEPS